MASRLYTTTRRLYLQVVGILQPLGIRELGSPTLCGLISLYVTGLILLDARQTQTRVARFLPGRCHDALNRLLRVMPLSTRQLLGLLIRCAQRHGAGYLCLDEVIVQKRWAKRLPWTSWVYSHSEERFVYGFVIVVLLWCRHDGRWRIPVGFRLWRPKGACAQQRYQTKLHLAQQLILAVRTAGLAFDYLVFDSHYTAGHFTRWLTRQGITWVGPLHPHTRVVYRGRKQRLEELAAQCTLKWRPTLALRACSLVVYAPTYGTLRVVVTQNRHGTRECLASHTLGLDLTSMVQYKRSRWSIETIFRDTKQAAGLAACQCRGDQALVRHVALVLLTFVILQCLRRDPTEPVGSVKERWQLAIIQAGELPPPPLTSCPPHLRATA
jgi:hypothetical protein